MCKPEKVGQARREDAPELGPSRQVLGVGSALQPLPGPQHKGAAAPWEVPAAGWRPGEQTAP